MNSTFPICTTALCLLSLLALGCQDLGDFKSGADDVFRGPVLGGIDSNCSEGEDCSFIRRGFAVTTVLDLTFDPELSYFEPGMLTTTGEMCDATFDATPLIPVAPLAHDQLSLYDFPGDGRVRNYIFMARPVAGPLAGREATVFVSLLRGTRIEVRVLSGAGGPRCNPLDCVELMAGDCEYFGVFKLKRAALP